MSLGGMAKAVRAHAGGDRGGKVQLRQNQQGRRRPKGLRRREACPQGGCAALRGMFTQQLHQKRPQGDGKSSRQPLVDLTILTDILGWDR